MKSNGDSEQIKSLIEEIVLETLGVTENLPVILSKHRVTQRKQFLCSNLLLLLSKNNPSSKDKDIKMDAIVQVLE